MPTASVMERDTWDPARVLNVLLEAFLVKVREAVGIVVAGPTGKPIASKLPADRMQLLAASAMARLTAQASEAVAANLRLQGMRGVTIEGSTWKVVVAPTPSHAAAVLVTLVESADVGHVHRVLPALLRAVDRTLKHAAVAH